MNRSTARNQLCPSQILIIEVWGVQMAIHHSKSSVHYIYIGPRQNLCNIRTYEGVYISITYICNKITSQMNLFCDTKTQSDLWKVYLIKCYDTITAKGYLQIFVLHLMLLSAEFEHDMHPSRSYVPYYTCINDHTSRRTELLEVCIVITHVCNHYMCSSLGVEHSLSLVHEWFRHAIAQYVSLSIEKATRLWISSVMDLSHLSDCSMAFVWWNMNMPLLYAG